MTTNTKPISTVYFSHGGGPLPLLGDPSHKAMIDFMLALPEKLVKPAAIIVISAHWEEKLPTLLGAEYPGMFYDYYGFPETAYQIQYPCLAARPWLPKHRPCSTHKGFQQPSTPRVASITAISSR